MHQKYQEVISSSINDLDLQIVKKGKITESLPAGVNHQSIALYTSHLPSMNVEDILTHENNQSTILLLDQITDVGNIGAILRSAAAFSADAVILPKHHAPDHATISKTASGALETVPLIYVNNITNTMLYAQKQGYWCYGMDEKAETLLHDMQFDQKRLIVLGSENSGLRRLTQENCDYMVKIPIAKHVDSLNVSNAAAIILYSLDFKPNQETPQKK